MFALLLVTACQDQGLTSHNENPEALITTPDDGDSVTEGVPFELIGVVSDVDDSVDTLTVTWMLGAEELCSAVAPDITGFTQCEATLDRGEHEVTLLVLDPTDAAGTDTVGLTAESSDAPTVTITSPVTGNTYYNDQPVILEATVLDDRDAPDTLALVWTDGTEDLGLNPTADESGLTTSSLYLDSGSHTLTLTATDSLSLTGSDTVSVLIGGANVAPDCSIIAPASDETFNQGETVTFEGMGSDEDVASDQLTATWESDVDGALGSGALASDGSTVAVASALTQATHIVTLEVSDEVGATCTDQVVVTVGTPPTLVVSSPSDGDVVNDGERVSFSATVEDGEDPPQLLSLSWNSDLDGEFSTQGADASGAIAFTTGDLGVGSHTISARATDTDGFYAQVNLALRINALPEAPTVSLSPDPAYTTDELVLSIDVDGADPDGDPVAYSYSWARNGVASKASTSTSLPASATSKGETWAVTVTPTDGYGDGASGSASLTISNSPPSVSSATLSPDPAVTTDDLTCTAGATSDEDGDSVNLAYSWSIDGSTTTGTGTLSAAATTRGQSIFCIVTPSDGSDAGTSLDSNTVVIDNSPPVISGVTLTPTSVRTDDVLTANVSWSDDDSDGVTLAYAWAVDGSTVAETGSTLDGASWFDKGEVVVVTVTPDDGIDSGTPVSSSGVTVLNSGPAAPVITIEPAAPYNGIDDLQCMLDTPSTDPDGDAITYSLGWDVDGVPFASPSTTIMTDDTVAGSFTSPGEVWTCTLTPSDAWDTGSTATVSVTIGCLDGSDASCPAADCATILADGGSMGDGTYWIDPVGAGAYEVWCDMTTDSGGWTLVAVSSDDGQDTWTWDNRHYWDTDSATFGNLSSTHEDMKSLALNEVSLSDLLFVHHPSGDWASYGGVSDGAADLGTHIGGVAESVCWDESTDGIAMTAGTIAATGSLCTTDLFFNAADADGQSSCTCTNCADAHGPVWSAKDNGGCPFDDPGRRSGLGPSAKTGTTEHDGVGYGWALGLNTGSTGNGENYIWVLVR